MISSFVYSIDPQAQQIGWIAEFNWAPHCVVFDGFSQPLEFKNIKLCLSILKVPSSDIFNDFLEHLCDGVFVEHCAHDRRYSAFFPAAFGPTNHGDGISG